MYFRKPYEFFPLTLATLFLGSRKNDTTKNHIFFLGDRTYSYINPTFASV